MAVNQKFAGAAVQTTVVGSMTPTVPGVGQTFTLTDDTGWPTGGEFTLVNSVGLSNEEKILCTRSGATCTVVQRGYDDTTPQTHPAGSPCEHRVPAAVMTAIAQHIDGLEATPHSGVLLNNAAHDVEARHTFGAALGTPVTPTALTPDIAGAAGTGNNPAREDHAHNVPTATAVTSGLANAEGAAGTFARSDHTHNQAALSVDTAELVNGAVTAAKLDDDADVAGKIAAGGVSATDEIADGIVTQAKLGADVLYIDIGSFDRVFSNSPSELMAVTFNVTFASAPVVLSSCEVSTQNFGSSIENISTTGATLRAWTRTGSYSGTVKIRWVAIGLLA